VDWIYIQIDTLLRRRLLGEHIFPDDFGVDPKAVTAASRNCSDCKRDKTLLYAILTKKRISDIQNIDRGILHNILTKSKGIAVDFLIEAMVIVETFMSVYWNFM